MKKILIYIFLFSLSYTSYAQNYPTGQIEINDMKTHVLYKNIKRANINMSLRRLSSGISRNNMSYIDNSTLKYFPPIIFQKGSSCAYASGIGYIYNYEYNLANNLDSSLPENIYNYVQIYSFFNKGIDHGGFPILGWMYAKENGIPSIKDAKITNIFDWCTGYNKYFSGMDRGVESTAIFYSDEKGEIENMKQYLIDHGNGSKHGGLIQFSAYAHPLNPTKYLGPKLTNYDAIIPYFGNDGMHSMTICGFDDSIEYDYSGDGIIQEEERGAFICVNSWGKTWGYEQGCNSKGRFYAPYYAFSTLKQSKYKEIHTRENMGGGTGNGGKGCLILTTKKQEKSLTLKVKIKHSSRNDIMLEVGVFSKKWDLIPEKTLKRIFMNKQGGDFTMRGIRGNKYETIEFGLNISELLEYTSNPSALYFLKIRNMPNEKEGEGELLSCSLLYYGNNNDNPVEFIAKINRPRLCDKTECYATINISSPELKVNENLSINCELDSFNKRMLIYLSNLNSVDAQIDLLSANGILLKQITSKTIPPGISSEIVEFGDIKAGTYWGRIIIGNKYIYKKLIIK